MDGCAYVRRAAAWRRAAAAAPRRALAARHQRCLCRLVL